MEPLSPIPAGQAPGPRATERSGEPAILPATAPRSLLILVLVVGLVAGAAAVGALANARAIPEWYDTLRKPGFTPPNAVFPIVWPILYATIAFSGWRIWRVAAAQVRGTVAAADARAALVAFLVQLALNAAWSWAFFGARSPMLGLVAILALDVAVVETIRRAWPLDRPAALALLPYLAWILFATALNFAILQLNG